MELEGKTAILTGASRGIGKHLALRLAREGVHLALAARSAGDLEKVAADVSLTGVRSITVPTDVTRRSDLERLVERAEGELGDLDILINNAGIECVGYFERIDPSVIESAVQTNLTAPILLAQLAAQRMLPRGRGHIVNIASTAAKVHRPYGVVYAGTKHGLLGFSWSLRAELARRGIGVSVVCPHYVLGDGMFVARGVPESQIPRFLKAHGLDKVADATIAAITKNRAEVVLGPAMIRASDFLHAVSPDAAMWIGRKTGGHRFARREATGD
jgi:short-subunit dehydrogenase